MADSAALIREDVEAAFARLRQRGETDADAWLICDELVRLAVDRDLYRARYERRSRTLRMILGLLAERRWWNGNVWGAEQLAKEALLDVQR